MVTVAAELAPFQRLAGGRELPACIAGGEANRLGPKVQREQRTAIWKRVTKLVCDVGNQRPELQLPTRLTTSDCRFFQNSGMS